MQIKVDEDLPNLIVDLLREKGYDALSVVEQGMGGWKDPDLWRVVQSEKRFLITGDKGFADIRSYPPGEHAGVLLLRPDDDGVRPLIELMQRVLASYDLVSLSQTTIVVSPRSVRMRRAKK